MSIGNPWAKHYQRAWEERAGDPLLPLWLRVASLAYGMHRANGHAVFANGDIALVLVKVDKSTGEVLIPTRQAVDRAIATAVEYGWLSRESSPRCLVVPPHAVEGGLGYASEACEAKHRTQAPRSLNHSVMRNPGKAHHSVMQFEPLSDAPQVSDLQ